MEKKFLTFLLASMAGAVAAQPTLTVADGPEADQMMTYFTDQFVPITETGADAVWDLSDAEELAGPDIIYFVSPDATGFEAQFPSATVAMDDGTNYSFMRVADDGRYITGQRVVTSGLSILAHYTDEQLVLPFPCTFNTAFTDSFLYNYTVQGMTVDGSGFSSYTANGFGTLILPHGPVDNVLMLTGEFVLQEEIPDVINIRTEMDNVIFYKPGFPDFVAQTQQAVRYQDGEQTGSGSALFYAAESAFAAVDGLAAQGIGVEVWPVPATTQLNISYGLAGGHVVEMQLVDMTGKVVRRVQDRTALPGVQLATLDVEGLPVGLYVLNITDDHGQRGARRVVLE